MGFVAVALLLVAELNLVLWLRGLSLNEYLASRDPVSGTVYYLMLFVFALMPTFICRSEPHASKLFKITPAA
jgi:type IV secretory pathway TrbD component